MKLYHQSVITQRDATNDVTLASVVDVASPENERAEEENVGARGHLHKAESPIVGHGSRVSQSRMIDRRAREKRG